MNKLGLLASALVSTDVVAVAFSHTNKTGCGSGRGYDFGLATDGGSGHGYGYGPDLSSGSGMGYSHGYFDGSGYSRGYGHVSGYGDCRYK